MILQKFVDTVSNLVRAFTGVMHNFISVCIIRWICQFVKHLSLCAKLMEICLQFFEVNKNILAYFSVDRRLVALCWSSAWDGCSANDQRGQKVLACRLRAWIFWAHTENILPVISISVRCLTKIEATGCSLHFMLLCFTSRPPLYIVYEWYI